METSDVRRTKITARDDIQMRRDLVLTRLMDRGLLEGRLVFVGKATKGSHTLSLQNCAVDKLHQACTFIKTENIAVNEIGRIICSHILLHAQ